MFLGSNAFGFKVVESFSLGRPIQEAQNVTIRKSPFGASNNLIVEFFLNAETRPNVFEAGLKALHAGNLPLLVSGELFPDAVDYTNDDSYENAWSRLEECLRPMDALFTCDCDSRLSRFIAWATDGPWSHVASYIGDGELAESVTSGIRIAPLKTYKGRRYRVGAYRHIDSLDKQITTERAHEIARTHHFRPNSYNYVQAVRYGMKAFFGDHGHALVPNSQIYSGLYFLVACV